MLKLTRFLRPYTKQVVIGPAFKLTEAVLELIVPLVMSRIIDVGVRNGDAGYVLRMGLLMAMLGMIGLACALVCQYNAAIASQGFGTLVRNELFRHINTLSNAEIDQLTTPSLITRLTSDVNQLQVAVAMLIRLVIRAPFLIIGATVMAMLLDLKLSIVFLAVSPLIALALYWIMSRSAPRYSGIQKKLDAISMITRENLSGARVIRAFTRQKGEQERFKRAADSLSRASETVGRLSALLNPMTYAILNFGIIAILWFGGMRVYSGALSQGEVYAFVTYMTQIQLALVVVANLVVIFTKASASAARVNEVFALEASVTGAADPVSPAKGAPAVEFRDVRFSYTGKGEDALSGISFTLEHGKTLGVIGGTGSGKSTLVNLIPRFYDVSGGEVLVDGVNVKQIPLDALRSRLGLVPQRAELFTGTLRDNMKWGKEDATDAQINSALETAQALEFVSRLPDGLDTAVAQGGRNFSGGQRQRLTIARALVRQPGVLIMDDSASALDFATDAALRLAIRRSTKAMAVITVSQRAGTIMHSDSIMVLDDGRIAGMGTHAELLDSCEVYREICKSQGILGEG